MNSLRGHFVVASPHLPDPNFYRSVVLMVQHTEEGGLGLILNRPTQSSLKEVWRQVSDQPPQSDQALLSGGPVPGPLMALHTRADLADDQILPGVYFTTDKENLLQLVEGDFQPFLVFNGYSGWGESQLDKELEMGGWLTTPASSDLIFQVDRDELWKQVVGEIGDDLLRSSLKIDHLPQDPSMN